MRVMPMAMLLAGVTTMTQGQAHAAPAWADGAEDVRIVSSADGSEQPAVFYAPAGHAPVPLLVSLHTWSAGYTQAATGRLRWCIDHTWAFVHPHFRGPNNQPQAMGSELAVQDILDAVAYAKGRLQIDGDRIYVIGFSGGGHAALLLAGRAPEIWAAVSASCGISDLTKWHAQNPGYGRGIEAAVGGNPQHDPAAAAECARRSPVTWLPHATSIPIDIKAGIHDGHPGGGSVPVSQSLEAFNLLAQPEDRLSEEEIAFMTTQRAIPGHLQDENGGGVRLGNTPILFRRQSGNVRITIFDGGHQGFNDLAWMARQRKGAATHWDIPPAAPGQDAGADASTTGK